MTQKRVQNPNAKMARAVEALRKNGMTKIEITMGGKTTSVDFGKNTCRSCGHYIPHPKESNFNCSKHGRWVKPDEVCKCHTIFGGAK